MGYPKITDDIVNEIIKLYKSGNSSLIISKILKLSTRTILNYLHKNNADIKVINKLTQEIETEILTLYDSGIGSPTISKMLNIDKQRILKVLKKHKINTRTRFISDEFYSNFWKKDGKWCGYWTCEKCQKKIEFCVNKKSLLNRNLKNKKICRACYKKSTEGDGNIFYNKTHTNESKKLISDKKIGIRTSDHMSKPEYRELVSRKLTELWASGKMEDTRIKMSGLMKQRIANGDIKGYIRSKAEDELINVLVAHNIEVIPNYKIKSKSFDIFIPKYNLLIEYNGDYWHCNPKKYQSDYFNVRKSKTAKEIWDYDYNKLDLAKTNGYNIEVIWESDYKKNKKIIQNLIEKYNGETNKNNPC